MVIYGFICCIFSCGCKRLCRSGQRPQLASTPSKERYCCRRRFAEKWYRRSGRRLAYRYPSAARTDLLSPLRGFPPPLPHSRKRCIPCAESLLLWQSLPYPLPLKSVGGFVQLLAALAGVPMVRFIGMPACSIGGMFRQLRNNRICKGNLFVPASSLKYLPQPSQYQYSMLPSVICVAGFASVFMRFVWLEAFTSRIPRRRCRRLLFAYK